MDTEILIPVTVEIATIVLLLVAIGALLSIIKMVDGRLLKGWRLMLLSFFLALVAQVLGAFNTSGILKHQFEIYVRFAFVVVGLIALWQMAKTLDDCRMQFRSR